MYSSLMFWAKIGLPRSNSRSSTPESCIYTYLIFHKEHFRPVPTAKDHCIKIQVLHYISIIVGQKRPAKGQNSTLRAKFRSDTYNSCTFLSYFFQGNFLV